ncbi:MAG: hypothetical protein UZ21_OP11001000579 [Microgenomates bacterium OLB22]|nr:MAG: hypothetical protein UZ21_OP11001000579 [Microgenomates bacterium OLB22]
MRAQNLLSRVRYHLVQNESLNRSLGYGLSITDFDEISAPVGGIYLAYLKGQNPYGGDIHVANVFVIMSGYQTACTVVVRELGGAGMNFSFHAVDYPDGSIMFRPLQ